MLIENFNIWADNLRFNGNLRILKICSAEFFRENIKDRRASSKSITEVFGGVGWGI
jgi:hypothetical protein